MKGITSLLFMICLGMSAVIAQSKPNILIIISDDHAYQSISAYGSPYGSTPHIDRIANEGLLLHRAYVNNSLCGPSRASLLTGKYSHKNGFKENDKSHFEHKQNTFAKELRRAGYTTSWIGKQHLGDTLEGFDYFDVLLSQGHYFNPEFKNQNGELVREQGYVSDIVTDKALRWLESVNNEKPFCLVLGHKATHREWHPDPQDFGKNDKKSFPLPETFNDTYQGRKAAQIHEMGIARDIRPGMDLKVFSSDSAWMKEGNFNRMDEEDRAKYRAYYAPIREEYQALDHSDSTALAKWKYRRYMIDYLNTAESMDRNIGRVLDYLEEHDLKDNTLVIYMSDQGFYLGEHGWFDKRFMYEESFRTPMMIRYPPLITAGRTSDDLLMTIDIAPTLLALAGVPIPEDMQGESFVPVLKGDQGTRDLLYYHYYEDGIHNVSPHFGVSDGRYKLIRFYNKVNAWELFDMDRDPQELHNVYGRPEYLQVQKMMMDKLLKEIEKQEDTEAKEIVVNQI